MFQSLATLNQTLRQSRECKASWVLRSTEVWNRHFVAPGKSSKQSPVWALKSPSRQRLPGDNCYLGTKKEALNHPPTLQSSQSPLGIELVQREETVPWKGENLVIGQTEAIITGHLTIWGKSITRFLFAPGAGCCCYIGPLASPNAMCPCPWHNHF